MIFYPWLKEECVEQEGRREGTAAVLSDRPSETTNCNKSDIEYDMLKSPAQVRALNSNSPLVVAQDSSPTVARITSSGVVSPARTLRTPSSRSVRIPISRARARRTEDGTFS